MGRKKLKRKNVQVEMLCPIPQKAVRKEESALNLQKRSVYAVDVNQLLESKKLVLVRGPISCGKTRCASEVSALRKIPLKSFQINNELDSKTIFGSYNCTDVPGEFVWSASKFSKCLEEECLILLEDFGSAHADLAAAIFTLAETGEYSLNSADKRVINKNCRIVATLGAESSLNMIRDYPFFVEIPPLTNEDLSDICTIQFPRLSPVVEKVLKIFADVCASIKSLNGNSCRQLYSRDLFRLFNRLQFVSDFSDNMALFHEMADAWIMHLSEDNQLRKVALVIAESLSITEEQLSFLLNVRKPSISLKENVVFIGRAKISKQNESLKHGARSYGLTRGYCQLMERISVCISEDERREAVLLAGETGVGKTSVVQLLASYTGSVLKVVNLSQDSEYTDLIGGYKPVSVMNIIRPLADDYFRLFRQCFNVAKNKKFLDYATDCLEKSRVEDFLALVIGSAERSMNSSEARESPDWAQLLDRAKRLSRCFGGERELPALPFAYVRGIVAEAAEMGHWLLVDELNLASPECLDAVIQVLNSTIDVNPKFRLFACMNPATDVGKRNIPNNVRSKFTEFFVGDTTDAEELAIIVKNYLPNIDASKMKSILGFYTEVCLALPRKYSLRTLCRALVIVAESLYKDVMNALVAGFSISFTSNLDGEEQCKLARLISKHFGKAAVSSASDLGRIYDRDLFVEVGGSYIKKGNVGIKKDPHYIFTPSVKANLSFLTSVVATGRFPILLEGETSAGKTSMIQHLAKITGNRIYRINNHEHTDVQEYIGSYSPNSDGRLEFVEGILLRAVKNGDWIILDELNLAPPTVLEALNRLLDDNREVFVPELNCTISAHPRFQLFATQNPAGSYAGRKRLSRAFLNRFVIIKYEHLPFAELPKIVHCRCGVALSMAQKMVDVLVELKSRRSVSGIFSFSNGLMTLRDLFRWGNRAAMSDDSNCDWRQILADQGYFVLASRCRNSQDEQTVVDVLEKHLKRKISIQQLFSLGSKYMPREISLYSKCDEIVFTFLMRRMLVLCSEAWRCNEAILMVGETGCGKTTCAHILNEDLLSINCNERTETSDFLGSIRPTADGKFQWNDGIVLQGMKAGKKLLIDEISLAPDSVLERLNSLLESERSILLTDAGACTETVVAHKDFQIVATMNPGDDYGKKELSKALRNRFTEIWCPFEQSDSDVKLIMEKRMATSHALDNTIVQSVSSCFVLFFDYFREKYGNLLKNALTIRDLIEMAETFDACIKNGVSVGRSIYHALCANLFDAFGILQSRISFDRKAVIEECVNKLQELIDGLHMNNHSKEKITTDSDTEIISGKEALLIGEFLVGYGQLKPQAATTFSFDAPTTRNNAYRVARGLISTKPVMLEGSPGAGKSSLIVALAAATGNTLVRLNLSEQTDLCDLFGSDVPVITGEGKTTFAWKDGPVLTAIKEGSWILLDEMNLASQAVLEGLNSCFDFRKNLYISQLGRTFKIEKTKCRFFACQNPRSQGGDRKALPKSFLNRFTSIFIDQMTKEDYIFVLKRLYSESMPEDILEKMVLINENVSRCEIKDGAPFEFNLRDLLRWACSSVKFGACFGFELIYLSRVRNEKDRKSLRDIYDSIFGPEANFYSAIPIAHSEDESIAFGGVELEVFKANAEPKDNSSLKLLSSQTSILQRLAACVRLNWLCLLVGYCHAGKRSTVELLAMLSNRKLHVLRLTSETDALELLGSYEQVSIPADESAGSGMQFKWRNSDFVEAYASGKWILLEDVNCCSSAVLDCLNSCLEDGGELVIPGHAVDQLDIIKKHNDFRAFFTMDPKNGQLSRAMRNRSVEIFIAKEFCWNENQDDALNIVFNEPSRAAKEVCLQLVDWISSVSVGELLKRSCMISKDFPQDYAAMDCSASSLVLIDRPTLDHRITKGKEFRDCLAVYYLRCWDAVGMSKQCQDPLAAYILALITCGMNSGEWDTYAESNFAYINDEKKIMIGSSIASLRDTGTIDYLPIQNLLQLDPLTSITCKSSFMDLLSLLRNVHKSVTSENFYRLFSSEETRMYQESYGKIARDLRLCGPFECRENAERFVNSGISLNLRDVQELRKDQQPQELLSTLMDEMKEILTLLNSLCCGLVPTEFLFQSRKVSSLECLPWNDSETLQQYVFLELLNYSCNINPSIKTTVLGLLLDLPFVTIVANKFWSLLGFCSVPRGIPLNALNEFGTCLAEVSSFIWALNFLRKDIRASIRRRLSTFDDRFCLKQFADQSEESLPEYLSLALEGLKTVTPPLAIIDPVIADDVQLRYSNESLSFIDAYFDSIKRFLMLTTGGYDDTSLARMKNPMLCSLMEAKEDARNSISNLVGSSGISTFYRPQAEKFKELVDFLNGFSQSTTRSVVSLVLNNWSDIIAFLTGGKKLQANINLLSRQLAVFLQTCESFKLQLMQRFFDYPDFATMYITALNLLLVGVNCVLQRMLIQIEKREVFNKHCFPQISSILAGNSKACELEVIHWIIGKHSTLSLSHQLDSVLSHVENAGKSGISVEIMQWIQSKWRSWYAQNSEKKEQLYIFKAKKIGDEKENEDIHDINDLELRSYLPDFSELNDDDTSMPADVIPLKEELKDVELMAILQKLMQPFAVVHSSNDTVSYYSRMKAIDDMKYYGNVTELDEKYLGCQHIIRLRTVGRLFVRENGSSEIGSLDVYSQNDQNEIARCVKAIQELRCRIELLQQEFPENMVLADLLSSIERFLYTTASSPLMKLMALLEKVLTQGNEWQQLADRTRSIQPQLLVLQQILLDWRRLEVICWAGIVNRIEAECSQLAVLSSWPLFESLSQLPANTDAVEMERNDNALILMLIDWIHSSSLADFNARLFSAELLCQFAELNMLISGASCATRRFSPKLPSRITAIVHHFKIFADVVNLNFSKAKSEVEKKLKDFVDIFKYNDLNLWSVKQSAQKAHTQLFKILKPFKEQCREPITHLLLDDMPPMSVQSAMMIEVELPAAISGTSSDSVSSKILGAASKLDEVLTRIVDQNQLANLQDAAESFLILLKTDINYTGVDQETQEKLQGRALFDRQKQFAHLIRSAGGIGLNSRRGMQVNSEKLTTSAMSDLPDNELSNGMASNIDTFVRFATVSRNVFQRKFAAVKVQQQEHILKQVPVHVLSHLKGITEYGLHWIVNALQLLVERACQQNELFKDVAGGFGILIENCKFSGSSNVFNYLWFCEVHEKGSASLSKMLRAISLLGEVVECCPDAKDCTVFVDQLTQLAAEVGTNRLVSMRRESTAFEQLKGSIKSMKNCLCRLIEEHDLCAPLKNGLVVVKRVEEYRTMLNSELVRLREILLPCISDSFPDDYAELDEICSGCVAMFEKPFYTEDENISIAGIDDANTTAALLKIQQMCKGISAIIKADEVKCQKSMDSAKQVIELICRLNMEKACDDVSQLLEKLCSSKFATGLVDLQTAFEISNGLHVMMKLVIDRLSSFLLLFTSFYINFEAIGCRILSNGFVNPIPKAPENSTNAKDGDSTAENCGMGEGTGGEDDVTNQIESLDQIEGLKGEKSESADEQNNEGMTDDNQPIEMEDDFAADLENIDGEVNDDDEGTANDDGIENQVDWGMGEIEEADEQQLDPKLWEKPADAENPKDVEGADDASKLDDELDESNSVGEQEDSTLEQTESAENVDKAKGVEENDQKDSGEKLADEDLPNDDGMDDDFAADLVLSDKSESADEQNNEGMTDDNQPIEMEDDFAADLENIDGEVNNDDEEAANDDGIENQVDCGMGEIEEADEQQPTNAENPKDVEGADDASKLDDELDVANNVGEQEGSTLEQSENAKNVDKAKGAGKDDKKDGVKDTEKQNNEGHTDVYQPNEMEYDADDSLENTDGAMGDGESDEEGVTLSFQTEISKKDKYIVQSSTVEEASRTRNLFQRLMKQGVTCATNQDVAEIIQSSVDVEEEPLSFQRHKDVPENAVNIALNSYFYANSDAIQIRRLQEKFDGFSMENMDENNVLQLKWSLISDSVSVLSSMLAESLRMIIEPTVASRLQGDYRTGKRLNVRRLITYIASDYRKDRIWMRRTKKVKRNFQICIAVDDSASMKDNLMTEITCHGLCLIEKALRQLEIGKLSICKFGKAVKILSEFSSESNDLDGAKLLSELSFKQDKTDLANLLSVTGEHFLQARQDFGSSDQMLIILSDGRGVMADGLDRIRASLGLLIDEQVTVLFLIIDNGEKSIMDVKVAKFTDDGRVLFESYMEKFPFPFYAMINSVSMLPSTISEAIRQWFEFTCR